MVTVNLTNTAPTNGKFPAREYLRGVGVLSRKFNIVEALSQKGSAIAASDVFQLAGVPNGCLLLGASVFVEEVPASGALDATLDIGWSGAVDVIADGVSVFSSGFAAVGTNGALFPTGGLRLSDALDNYIRVKIATVSGTLASGVVRIDLVIADVSTDFANTSNV